MEIGRSYIIVFLKYFPISKVAELRCEIISFTQLEEESLGKSWDRFINCTLTGPKLSIPE